MKKRPLLVLCLAVAVLAVFVHSVRDDTAALSAVQNSLQEIAGPGGILYAEGTVRECDAVSEGMRLSMDHISIRTSDNSNVTLSSDLKFTLTTENRELLPGDRIRAEGRYMPFERAANPGQFDAQDYYFSSRTVGRLTSAEVSVAAEGGFSFRRVLSRLRRILGDSLLRVLEERDARTFAAVSLGEKAWMQNEWKQLFQEGGIAHMIAVSGLHISLIGMCFFRLLRRMGRGYIFSAVPSGLAVFAYALMTGFAVSAFRACVMFLIWLGAQAAGRKYDMPTGAAVAAAVLLITEPGALTQSSFLLSFGAVLSLGILAPRLSKPGLAVWNGLSSSAAICLGTLPVTLWFFYQFAPWSVLVNLAVVPLMSVLMVSGLTACAVGLFCVPAGIFIGAPVHYLLMLFEALCGIEQRLPLGVLVMGRPSVLSIVFYYVLLFAAFGWRGRRIWTFAGKGCLIACALFLLSFHPRSAASVTCLDVGQGDSSLLRFADGTNCLIDAGSSSEDRVWEYRIGPAVKYYGIRELDYVFLSHGDSDHTNGILEYLESFSPGFGGKNAHGVSIRNLVLPPTADPADFEEIRKGAERAGIPVLKLEAGGLIAAGGRADWSLSCLAPSSLCGEKNEDSMVLLLRSGDFRMLFTGDLEGNAEDKLAASGADLSADVLKVGHHGSKGASKEPFLAAVNPAVGIISCAEHNVHFEK